MGAHNKGRRKTRRSARSRSLHFFPKEHSSSERLYAHRRGLKQELIDRMAERNAKPEE